MKSIILPCVFFLSSLCLPAIDIVVSYNPDHDDGTVHDADDGSDPAFPNEGDKLLLIANAAAEYWESIIKDFGTLTLEFRYQPLSDSNIGHWTQGTATSVPHPFLFQTEIEGRNKTGEIEIDDDVEWFYDLTPRDHSEYVFTATLLRDLSEPDRSNFNGSPPPTLEVNYIGTPAPGAPIEAVERTDLYSVVLHEIGHALGMTTQLEAAALEASDGQFDLNPAHLNGATCGMTTNPVRMLHPLCQECLMNSGIGRGKRRLPSAADVLALAVCPLPNYSQIDLPRKDFLPGGTGNWHLADNWTGKRFPDSLDDVFVRLSNPGGVFGVTPFPVSLASSVLVDNVTVGDYSVVSTGAHRLRASSSVSILHDGGAFDSPTIEINAGGELESRDLSLQGGTIRLRGGLLDVDRELDLATLGSRRSTLRGFGTVDVIDLVSGSLSVRGKLINDGSIVADEGGTLTLQSTGNAPWDLDGTQGSGEVVAVNGDIAITGGALTDAFEGRMAIGDGRSITIAEDWTIFGDNAELDLDGGSGPATLGGTGALTMILGKIDVTGDGRILCPLTLRADAMVEVSGGANLILGGETELFGGSYTGNGRMRFDQTLTIAAPTTFAIDRLDLDGLSGNTIIHLNKSLSIDASELDSGNSRFDGTLNLNNSLASFSVQGPASWEMAGEMNLVGSSVFQFPMIVGVPVEISGTATVSSESAWSPRTTISGTVQMISDANDRLILHGGSQADPNRLENGGIGFFGTLELRSNAWLNGWGLISAITQVNPGSGILADDGTLILARAPGLANNTTLGTADNDGTLQVNPDWTLPAGAQLTLSGGSVTGGRIESNSLITGFGTLACAQVGNSGEIRASGGTLLIDTTANPDLDGTAAGRLEAVEGNLTVSKAVTDQFGGVAEIGAGRTMTFESGWTLDSNGTLILSGNESVPTEPARLDGPNNVVEGDVELSGPSEVAAARFASGANLEFASGASLTMTSATIFESGVEFMDAGGAHFASAFPVQLSNNAILNVPSTLTGTITLGAGTSVASATLRAPDFQNATTLRIDIAGDPSTGSRDLLVIDGPLRLDGTLQLAFSTSSVAPGDTWKVVDGTALSGRFDTINHSGLPAGLEPRIYVLPDGAYLKLARVGTIAEWAATENLPVGGDGFGDDPDHDGILNAWEAFLGTNPLDAGDGMRGETGFLDLDGTTYFSLTIQRKAHIEMTDLSLDVMRSDDHLNWTNNNTGSIPPVFDPVTCLETWTFFSKIPIPDREHQFLRLTLTRP